ncbi:C40 family peptidase [Lentzea sp. NPDC051208]|uniref:C40 family peptidase n=1 Tax=Lentzea sp. NPDC051208 TaxID=3154642 RepID=UPI00343BDFD1
MVRILAVLFVMWTLFLAAAPSSGGSPLRQQPSDTGTSPALLRYRELSRAAERANQDVLAAQQRLTDSQAARDRASGAADLAAARAAQAAEAETSARTTLIDARAEEDVQRLLADEVVAASLGGLRLDGWAALLSSESQEEFLAAGMLMDLLAAEQDKMLDKVSAAVAQAEKALRDAESARRAADEASVAAIERRAATVEFATAAQQAMDETYRRKQTLDAVAMVVARSLAALSEGERRVLGQTGPVMSADGLTGSAGGAVRYALAQVGKPYVWGAVGPHSFDCSGLVQSAYRSVGVAVPRVTYDQVHVGVPVARDQVRPGDLVFYYSGPSHVAVVVDSTWSVHAATSGEPIKVSRTDHIGPITAIRRVAG